MQDSNFLTIPYKRGGRTKQGADCFGIVALFLEEMGIPFCPTSETDGKNWKYVYLEIARNLEIVNEPKRGDISIISKSPKFHMGVFLDQTRVMHMIERGVLISDRRRLKTEEILRWK